MDLENLNAPQFVNFGSDSFQDSSEFSEDSLLSKHDAVKKDSVEQNQTYYDSIEMERTEDNAQSGEMGVSIIDDTSAELTSSMISEESEFGHAKENFPVQKNVIIKPQSKSALNKATVPEPFQFRTSIRIRNRPTDSSVSFKEQDFTSQLRRNTILQTKKQRLTKVEPFRLTENKKRKRTENEFKSLAEQVSAFQTKTPERYHTSHKAFEPQEHWEPPHLSAKSPNLQAKKRRRIVSALSKEQQEEKEIEEMKAHEFHARPVNPKIYRRPSTDKQQVKAMIKTKRFYLKTAQRALQYKRKSLETPYQFRARPVPANILKGPTGLKEKPVIRQTEPKSPKFESENRLEKRKQMKVHQEIKDIPEKRVHKHAAPPPPPAVPWTKKRTEVCPFSFDTADKQRYLQKEKRIQEEIENEKKGHEFHAQLMPYPAEPVLPVVAKKPLTKPEPFNFTLSDRTSKQFSFTTEKNILFKAQPATVLKKEPFIPEKPPKQPLEIQEFNLHTNKRASERLQLKQMKEAEEQEREKLYSMQKAQEEKLERKELMKFRQEIVHKANPVRQYKPFEIKQGLLPLTTPQTPDFKIEKRLKKAKHNTE